MCIRDRNSIIYRNFTYELDGKTLKLKIPNELEIGSWSVSVAGIFIGNFEYQSEVSSYSLIVEKALHIRLLQSEMQTVLVKA